MNSFRRNINKERYNLVLATNLSQIRYRWDIPLTGSKIMQSSQYGAKNLCQNDFNHTKYNMVSRKHI